MWEECSKNSIFSPFPPLTIFCHWNHFPKKTTKVEQSTQQQQKNWQTIYDKRHFVSHSHDTYDNVLQYFIKTLINWISYSSLDIKTNKDIQQWFSLTLPNRPKIFLPRKKYFLAQKKNFFSFIKEWKWIRKNNKNDCNFSSLIEFMCVYLRRSFKLSVNYFIFTWMGIW